MIEKSLSMHVGLLVCSAALAAHAWLKEDDSKNADTVEVWGGKPSEVTSIKYEAQERDVLLEAKSDETGSYFVGQVERPKPPERPQPDEDAPHDAPPPAVADPGERETLRFVAVKEANELLEKLAPLQAIRSLGKLDESRLADFGFDAEQPGKLTITIGGQVHELIVGASTPGGSDTYARFADGEAFVLDGQLVRSIITADARLMERQLRSWEDEDTKSVKVTAGEASRELVRTEQKSFWADPASADQKDETASNWMDKFERLRVTEYVENPEPPPTPLFEVAYVGEGGKALGTVTVARAAGDSDKPEFLARSPNTRWWGKVLRSNAEQLAQDVAALLSR